jgi:hypothetical protein
MSAIRFCFVFTISMLQVFLLTGCVQSSDVLSEAGPGSGSVGYAWG